MAVDTAERERPPTTRGRWRFLALSIAVPFIVTRLILLAAGFVALNQLKTSGERRVWEIGRSGQAETVRLEPPGAELSGRHYWAVNILSRWDAQWYLQIARHGYMAEPGNGLHSNTAFFPLYPALMALASRATNGTDASILIAGIAIANLSLLVALVCLAAMVRLDCDEETAKRSVLYVLVFPTTFFFSAVYTESLFMAASIAALYGARRGKWLVAGLAGVAATLTRPPGILIFAALALEYMHQRQFHLRKIRADVLALGLVPLALCTHFAYLGWKFGSFWTFLNTEKAWGRPLVNAPHRLAAFQHFSAGDLLIASIAICTITAAWRKLRPSYACFATLTFLMPLFSGTLLGMGRFCAIIFPMYIVLALAGRNQTFDRYWLITSSAFAVLFMALFAQWHYVG